MWSVTGGDFGFEAGQIIGFHKHFLIIPILIHGPFSWLRFGGVLIHIAKKTPDQHLLPNPGASQDLFQKKQWKIHHPHPNPKKLIIKSLPSFFC